jgi:hypothetical protein
MRNRDSSLGAIDGLLIRVNHGLVLRISLPGEVADYGDDYESLHFVR